MPKLTGAASKEKEKSQRALQEAIDLGLVQKHGSGKKSRQKASAERKRSVGGLYEVSTHHGLSSVEPNLLEE